MGLAEERERARSLATRIVSFAIGIVGIALMLFAFFLTYRGGVSMLFLSLILFVLGFGVAALGFFFQLVPMKLDELAAEKRAYDARVREREQQAAQERAAARAAAADGAESR